MQVGAGAKNESGASFRDSSLAQSASRKLVGKKGSLEKSRLSRIASPPKLKILSIQ